MSLELNAAETVLLFGGPAALQLKSDGSARLSVRRDDFSGAGTRNWVVYAELADMNVAVNPSEAAALALRVLSRPVHDDLLISDSLILDRRAEVLSEAANTAALGEKYHAT